MMLASWLSWITVVLAVYIAGVLTGHAVSRWKNPPRSSSLWPWFASSSSSSARSNASSLEQNSTLEASSSDESAPTSDYDGSFEDGRSILEARPDTAEEVEGWPQALEWHVGTAELEEFCSIVDGQPDEAPNRGAGAWHHMCDKTVPADYTYSAWRRSLPDGLTEYKSVCVASGITPHEFIDFTLDDGVRQEWESFLKRADILEAPQPPVRQLHKLQGTLAVAAPATAAGLYDGQQQLVQQQHGGCSCSGAGKEGSIRPAPASSAGASQLYAAGSATAWAGGVERPQVVRWKRQFPFHFITDREYIIARAIIIPQGSADTGSSSADDVAAAGEDATADALTPGRATDLYVVTRGLDHHSAAPSNGRGSGLVRTARFFSCWRCRLVPCPFGLAPYACECVLVHREDMKIPERLARMAVSLGMSGFVHKMCVALKQYAAKRRARGVSPLALDPMSYGHDFHMHRHNHHNGHNHHGGHNHRNHHSRRHVDHGDHVHPLEDDAVAVADNHRSTTAAGVRFAPAVAAAAGADAADAAAVAAGGGPADAAAGPAAWIPSSASGASGWDGALGMDEAADFYTRSSARQQRRRSAFGRSMRSIRSWPALAPLRGAPLAGTSPSTEAPGAGAAPAPASRGRSTSGAAGGAAAAERAGYASMGEVSDDAAAPAAMQPPAATAGTRAPAAAAAASASPERDQAPKGWLSRGAAWQRAWQTAGGFSVSRRSSRAGAGTGSSIPPMGDDSAWSSPVAPAPTSPTPAPTPVGHSAPTSTESVRYSGGASSQQQEGAISGHASALFIPGHRQQQSAEVVAAAGAAAPDPRQHQGFSNSPSFPHTGVAAVIKHEEGAAQPGQTRHGLIRSPSVSRGASPGGGRRKRHAWLGLAGRVAAGAALACAALLLAKGTGVPHGHGHAKGARSAAASGASAAAAPAAEAAKAGEGEDKQGRGKKHG